MFRPPIALLMGATLACTASSERGERLLPNDVEAISLLGDTLVRPSLSSDLLATREEDLTQAQTQLAAAPDDPDALIWVGRRLAYLGRYRDAIDTYTQALARHPEDARLYRHRGHRYITVRDLAHATQDLLTATQLTAGRPDDVEPDGQPNAAGIPTSTLQSNIWYHLGLAHYLQGDFERAASAYRECLRRSTTTDMQVATRYWLYMTLRRLGRAGEAAEVLEPVNEDMEILENHDYFELLRMSQGARDPDTLLAAARRGGTLANATVTYGIANWYLYSGRPDDGIALLREILSLPEWAAFGYIAAEAELARQAAGP